MPHAAAVAVDGTVAAAGEVTANAQTDTRAVAPAVVEVAGLARGDRPAERAHSGTDLVLVVVQAVGEEVGTGSSAAMGTGEGTQTPEEGEGTLVLVADPSA